MKKIDIFIEEIWNDEKIDSETKNEMFKLMLENLKALERNYIKLFISVLITMLAFELLTNSAVSEFEVAGVRVTNFSMIIILFPIFFSLQFHSLFANLSMRRFVMEGVYSIIKKKYPGFYEGNIDSLLLPLSTANIQNFLLKGEKRGFVKFMLKISTFLQIFVAFLLIPYFIGYTYWVCFLKYGISNILLWTTIPISFFLIGGGLLFFSKYGEYVKNK